METFTVEEAREKLEAELPTWHVNNGHLWRSLEFEDFVEAMGFVNRVAEVAEEYEHHPDIHVHYNEVDLEVWTHEEDGITAWDLELASRIEALEH